MQKGKCKLCLKDDVDLLTKSHIIPNFLFKEMKDGNNTFVQIAPDNYVEGRKQHIKIQRDSFHESNILCVNCDGKIIKQYEDYLKLTFHSTNKSISRPTFVGKINETSGFSILLIENLNFKLYKLGFLSILWRASISSLSFFKSIDLGPHSETIRKMILNGDALEENDYPFFTSILNQNKDEYQIILPITKFKMKKYTHYRMIINGLDLIFMIGSNEVKLNQNLLDYVPNQQNKLRIMLHKEYYGKDMLISFLQNSNESRPKY